ncbi:hypothetical protein K9L05_00675 [Candidatus Babeliales bacterium]|nr:hypothetical protein [Candidatus Babeliales bacterium]MCF7899148.1 hypothetical protein [Candidatus Babeliales bacterium]
MCKKDLCDNHDHSHAILERHSNIKDEIYCHLPIAIFSVAFSMIVLSFLGYFDVSGSNLKGAHRLFHNFHFLHLLFAGTGTMLTFRRYSKNVGLGILIGFLVPAIFCTTSDALLPYVGGTVLGIDMELHWCFFHHIKTVSIFLIIGMINGWIMSGHDINKQLFYSQGFHFLHIFISSMASILYLVSFGFSDWHKQMGVVFIFLIAAVLVPCTFSDIVVPMIFAKFNKKSLKTGHTNCLNNIYPACNANSITTVFSAKDGKEVNK